MSVSLPENCIIFYTSSPIDNGIETKIPISLTQFDTKLAVVAFTILEQNKVYIPPSGADINVRWEKADGNGVYNPVIGVDDDGVVYFEVTTQMTAAEGMGSCCIEIGYDGGQKNTKKVPVYVSKNPVNNENIESSYEYKTLQTMFQEVKDLANEAQQSATDAENSANEAQQSATDAENSANEAQQSASQAEQTVRQVTQKANEAADSANLSKSWAIGGTGLREDENVNNSKYWAEQAMAVSNGYLGYYNSGNDLEIAHPTGKQGDWAIVGETGSMWIWNVITSEWEDTAKNAKSLASFTMTIPNSGWTATDDKYSISFSCPDCTENSRIVNISMDKSNASSISETDFDTFVSLFQYVETEQDQITFYNEVVPSVSMSVVCLVSV